MPDQVDFIIKSVAELAAVNETEAALNKLDRTLNATSASFEKAAASSRVYFNSVSQSTLSAVNSELQTQLAIMRQLGSQAATYSSEQRSQLDTKLGVLRAESDAMRRGYQEQTAARVAASNAVINTLRIEDTARTELRNNTLRAESDAMRRGYQEQTAAHARAKNIMATLDKQHAAEEARGDGERRKLLDRISPQTAIRFDTNKAGELHAVADGIRGIGTSSNFASKEMGHAVAIFDELMRGNFRAVISSIGSGMRDAGLGAAALGAGVAALLGVFAVSAFEKMVTRFGDLALKERSAAAAVAMDVRSYSELRAVFELASGTAIRFDETLSLLADHAGTALANPLSKSASAFATMRISMGQLTEGMNDPIKLLGLLRARWNEMGESMLRTETFRALLGRGFESLIPYLNLTDIELGRLTDSVRKAGNFMDKEASAKLAEAGEKARGLTGAIEGLEQRLAILGSGSGFTVWLTGMIEGLSRGVDGWNLLADAIKNQPKFVPTPEQKRFEDKLGNVDAYGLSGLLLPDGSAAAPAAKIDWKKEFRTQRLGGLEQGGGLTSGTIRVEGMDKLIGVDQNAVTAFREATRVLPPGWHAEATSGVRHGSRIGGGDHGVGEDGTGHGIDFTLFDAAGRPVPRQLGIQPGTQAYNAYKAVGDRYMDVGGHRWGGYFGETDIGHLGNNPRAPLGSRVGQMSPGGNDWFKPISESRVFTKEDLEKDKKIFDQAVKEIENETKLRKAADDKAVAEAGHNKDLINKIAVDRATFDGVQAQREATVRKNFADQIMSTGVSRDDPVVVSALDNTNSMVKAKIAEVDAVKARNAVEEEGYRQQINALQAKLRLTFIESERLIITGQISEIEAKLTDSGRGAVILAEEQRKAIEQRVMLLDRAYIAQQKMGNTLERTVALDMSQRIDSTSAAKHEAEIKALADQFNKLVPILNARKELATQIGNEAELEKIKSDQIELGLTTLEKFAKIQKEVRDDAKKVIDAWGAPFKSAMDSMGSAVEKAFTDILLKRGTIQEISKSLYQSATGSLVSLGGSVLSKAAAGPTASLLGYKGDTAGKGVGDVLSSAAGDWIGKKISDLLPDLGMKAVTDAPLIAASTANTAAIIANTAALGVSGGASLAAPIAGAGLSAAVDAAAISTPIVTAIGTSTVAIVASLQEIAAISAFDAVTPFARGGIVPSAAGGWRVPNFPGGGQPALVHSGEMVLPQKISEWVQKAANEGSGSGDTHVHIAPGGMILDGPSFNRWFLNGGGKQMIHGAIRDGFRSNALTPRSI